jgi:hypothetical protein
MESKLIFHSKQKQVNFNYRSEMNTGALNWFTNDVILSMKQQRIKIISAAFVSFGAVK